MIGAEERLTHVRDYAIQCIKEEADATINLINQLDDNFEKAVDLMYHCTGKVIVTGVGKSGNIGAKIAATLSSTGTPAFFVNPLDVYHGDLGVMKEEDVVLALSNSGQTDEFTVADYASEIERFAGVKLDHVLYNNHRPSQELIDRYAKDGEMLVEWNKEELKKKHFYASGKRLIADEVWENTNASSDPLAAQRSLIRHDADRVARELMRIYFA